jgi:hypothetical protein
MEPPSVNEPFGFEVSRPGDGKSPGYEPDENWTLCLPHQCDEWIITSSANWHEAMSAARRFRDELDAAIAVLYDAAP